MRVLALDTTTRAGSVALIDDDRIVAERRGDGAVTHASRMPGEILALADAQHWPLSTIDLYAVASGPGSFTGLRIGIATIQGLASVHHRRVVSVPALEALAHAGSLDLTEGALIGAWMDAHRGDVFAALFRVTAARAFSRARLIELAGATVATPAETLARWRTPSAGSAIAVVGDGAVLFAADIMRDAPLSRIVAPPEIAGAIGRLAVDREAEALEPAAVRPLYVRRPDVEVVRDEKRRQAERQSHDA
jgi:tRNA threonylcarbamoyladenosine biosynthesis protein TsaB